MALLAVILIMAAAAVVCLAQVQPVQLALVVVQEEMAGEVAVAVESPQMLAVLGAMALPLLDFIFKGKNL